MALHATWLHGNVIQATGDNADVSVVRARDGATVTSNESSSEAQFCAYIPTPVISEDKRVKLEKVFILDRMSGGIRLKNVFVSDTSFGLSVHTDNSNDFRNLPGADHSKTIDMGASGWLVANRPELHWGLGIWFTFYFGPSYYSTATGNALYVIRFTAIGADFVT